MDWKDISESFDMFAKLKALPNVSFVRHGETDLNRERILAGQSNAALTDLGRVQAQGLSRLFCANVDTVYCSSLGRSIETLQIAIGSRRFSHFICYDARSLRAIDRFISIGPVPYESEERVSDYEFERSCGKYFFPRELRIDSRWNEMALGSLEGKPYHSLDRASVNVKSGPPNGESYDEFGLRVFSAACNIIEEAITSGSRRVLVFTHAGVMRLLGSLFVSHASLADLLASPVANASILNFEGAKVRLPIFFGGSDRMPYR